MTTVAAGFILGLLSALFFAFYAVPQKLVRLELTTFLWCMALGVGAIGAVAFVWAGCPGHFTLPYVLLALLCGAIWSVGTLAFVAAVDEIGLAQATPIKNTTGIFGAVLGLLVFGEWRHTNPFLCLAGSTLIALAAIVIGLAAPREAAATRRTGRGVLLALAAALIYAGNLVFINLVLKALGIWAYTPLMSLGILLFTTLLIVLRPGGVRRFLRHPARSYLYPALGGLSWGAAMLCLAGSMQRVDTAIAWSLSQLNTVPAVLLGALIFKEVSVRRHWPHILLGLIAAVVGTVLLGMSR